MTSTKKVYVVKNPGLVSEFYATAGRIFGVQYLGPYRGEDALAKGLSRNEKVLITDVKESFAIDNAGKDYEIVVVGNTPPPQLIITRSYFVERIIIYSQPSRHSGNEVFDTIRAITDTAVFIDALDVAAGLLAAATHEPHQELKASMIVGTSQTELLALQPLLRAMNGLPAALRPELHILNSAKR